MSQLHDLPVDEYLRKSVSIEPICLQEEYVQLPADLAYWGARFADAAKTFLLAKMDFERMEARLRLEYRERMTLEGAKVTESTVDSKVLCDSEYVEQRIAYITAEAEKARLYGILDAIRAKKDMLVSLGATVRAEMQGSPQLREEVRTASMIRGQ